MRGGTQLIPVGAKIRMPVEIESKYLALRDKIKDKEVLKDGGVYKVLPRRYSHISFTKIRCEDGRSHAK